MKRGVLVAVLTFSALVAATAAERVFDLTRDKPGQVPQGFRSLLAGTGEPGDWQVVLEDVPPAIPPLTPTAPQVNKTPVIAQLGRDTTDERFPLLVFDEEVFGDFTLSAQVKMVAGQKEQMAGLAFRLQDERNFYVVRASALGNNFRFYRVANGLRDAPIGPELRVPTNVWHTIEVECRGNRIRCRLNGQDLIPELTDNSYNAGKIALWTKSDAVSHFANLRIRYTPREPLAKALVRDAHRRYPRLLGLAIYATTPARSELHAVASHDESQLGNPAGKYEKECLAANTPYAGKADGRTLVIMPLHDRNGEPIAVVRLELERFPGQTDQNAVARAMPVVRYMQQRVVTLKDLVE